MKPQKTDFHEVRVPSDFRNDAKSARAQRLARKQMFRDARATARKEV